MAARRRLRATCAHLSRRPDAQQPPALNRRCVSTVAAAAQGAPQQQQQQPPPAANPEDGLTDAEVDFFREHGYLIIRAAAPREACADAVSEVWRLAGKDPHDRNSWYSSMPAGMTRSGTRHPVQMRHQADLEAHMVKSDHHFPAAWEIRTSPRMHACFSQLWYQLSIFDDFPVFFLHFVAF